LPIQQIQTDFVVVGAGVAGLRAALELAQAGRVLVITKDSLRESSSEYAQGGIAAALNDDDEVGLHEIDTLNAGDGLCDPAAVRTLVAEAPAAIEELIEWGAAFDRENAKLLFAREGAHSRNRVLHAHGDSTGREIVRAMRERAASSSNIRFQSYEAVTDLLMKHGEVVGVLAFDETTQSTVMIHARAVLLATGGSGRVFENTTNPDVATGDGVAIAYRNGAAIADIEFVQFHPTALFVEGAPRFLLSEALRGDGAYLRNAAGERFMERYHEMKELAPRDVVSRSIVLECRATTAPCVYLDMTHFPRGTLRKQFPRVYQTCLHYGIDLETVPAPVRPAAHYAMGGIRTDLDGRASLPHLFAAGEVACTGVHGANRLASNSLLEGIVFGARAGRAMREVGVSPLSGESLQPPPPRFPRISETDIRAIAWNSCGILRSGPELDTALNLLRSRERRHIHDATRADFEQRNIHLVALLIAFGALARMESRGAHFRTDYPHKSSETAKHSVICRSAQNGEPEIAFVPACKFSLAR